MWETHKAYVRGILIKHGARMKRKRQAEIETLLKQIMELEGKHEALGEEVVKLRLQALREQLKDHYWNRAKGSLLNFMNMEEKWERGCPRL